VNIRIGQGRDIHRLVEGRKCIIGGVEIDNGGIGLYGHSDADVLVHAIIDALLGSLALGDIGRHFSDTDPKYKDADSMKLLEHTVGLIYEAGYAIVNIDSTVTAQKPKLAPHIDAMRENIARVLGLEISQVSVKAKTNEKLDAVGRLEAIEADAVVLIALR